MSDDDLSDFDDICSDLQYGNRNEKYKSLITRPNTNSKISPAIYNDHERTDANYLSNAMLLKTASVEKS